MQFQKLEIENSEGKKLAARLDLPIDEKPAAYALFAHCFTCSKNLNAVGHINRALALNGIAVLRFDFTGLGESEGDFAETNFSTRVADLVSAADFLESNYEAPRLLIGHSLGGAAVLQAAQRIPLVEAVATIAAPADLSGLRRFIAETAEGIETEGEAEITIGGRTFKVRRQFLEDLEEVRMEKVIRNLKKPLLVLHAPGDDVVDVGNAVRIFDAARQPKSFVALDGADHLLSERGEAVYAGLVLGAWARRYLAPPPEVTRQRDPADNRVTVRTGKKGFQTEITANEHRLTADEPIPEGGADTGPTPYELLVAALGACTSMTIRMYADRKQWPVDAVVVRLQHEKIHARDCRGCETREGKIDHIDREIQIEGPLSEEQRQRLLEIANRCPVHRTLHSEIKVTSHPAK
jgi:putative redox protein